MELSGLGFQKELSIVCKVSNHLLLVLLLQLASNLCDPCIYGDYSIGCGLSQKDDYDLIAARLGSFVFFAFLHGMTTIDISAFVE